MKYVTWVHKKPCSNPFPELLTRISLFFNYLIQVKKSDAYRQLLIFNVI